MNDKEVRKAVQSYTALFSDALQKKGFPDADEKTKQFSEKLAQMYRSDKYLEHDRYPTMDMKKIYVVVAMCLILKEDQKSRDEIIDVVNFAFRKPKKAFFVLIKAIDALPWAYKIAEKWNIGDHEKRVQDGSIHYELFSVVDVKIEYNITKCMYAEIFEFYGIRELCKIFCITDVQAYAGLTKHVSFTRYSDLSDGACCHDVISRK